MAGEVVIVVLFAALLAVIASMMFLKGYFHEETSTRWRRIIDPDKLFFPRLENRHVINAADGFAFLICACTAGFIVVYGILTLLGLFDSARAIKLAPSFLVAGVLASWMVRFVFIYSYKDTPPEKLPRVWPFKRR